MADYKEVEEACIGEGGPVDKFKKLGRSERYQTRKKMYRPGTLVAIELVSSPNTYTPYIAPEGSYGLAMIRECNWNTHIALFMFEKMFDQLPTLEQAQKIAKPENLWYWESFTDDRFIISGNWVVLGEVEPWDPTQWREIVAVVHGERNAVVSIEYKPNRGPRSKEEPITPELEKKYGNLPSWPVRDPSGSGAVMMGLSRSLTTELGTNHLPIGPERAAALETIRERSMAAIKKENQERQTKN